MRASVLGRGNRQTQPTGGSHGASVALARVRGMGDELPPPTTARGRLAISLSPAAIARLRGVRAAQAESRRMSLSCVLGLDSNRRPTSEPVPEMRAGRRALAALPDWRLRPTRLEIELVAVGTGRNGRRHRDSEDQNRNREQTATAEFSIASFPHRCVPCAWRAAGGPHDCSYGPSPPQAPESSPVSPPRYKPGGCLRARRRSATRLISHRHR